MFLPVLFSPIHPTIVNGLKGSSLLKVSYMGKGGGLH